MGNCYEATVQWMLTYGLPPDGYLVQGECQGHRAISDITFGHAWIEIGDTVLDVANGEVNAIPREIYYKIGRIEEIGNYRRYTQREATARMLEVEHYGPWDIITEY